MDATPQAAREREELEEALAEPKGVGFDGPAPSIDELLANEDVSGLMELGAAYRMGTPHVERDLFKALESFEAASRLGSHQAEYLVAVAHMNGQGIAKDLAEGATRMRSAAQRGSLRAKVYVANLYELGVHYAVDRDKADVWYRNVARAAGVEHGPDSDEYQAAMAELGCVRFCLSLVADQGLPAKDRAFYLKKAKAMGYAHRLQESKRQSERPAPPEPSAEAPEVSAPEAAPPEAEGASEPTPEPSKDEAPDEDEEPGDQPKLGGEWTFGRGLLAFLVAAFFAVTGSVCAFLATEGSRALYLAGRELPVVGRTHEAVLFGVLLLAGVLPAASVYRPNVVAIASVVGAAAGAGGWFLFEQTPVLWDAAAQAGAAGMAGFLVVLLFLGVLGGTRSR